MIVGNRLRAIREMRNLSQGDIEKRTGLLRCYVSRVENGHTVPAIETLEKMARALEIELYQLFFEPQIHKEPQEVKLPASAKLSGKDSALLVRLTKLVPQMEDRNKKLLLGFVQKLAAR